MDSQLPRFANSDQPIVMTGRLWNLVASILQGSAKLSGSAPIEVTDLGEGGRVVSLRRDVQAQFCLVQQNGSDPNGDPMYDVYDLDDTGHVTKLNEDPVVPENWRSPDLTYTAGTSGIYQIDAEGNFFLGVWDEERTCT